MRKIVLSLLLCLSLGAFAQSPPQIPLTGNIGVEGSVAILGGTTVALPSDANYTLTPAQWANKTLVLTSAAPLTATRIVTAPLNKGQEFNIENSTTGGQSITIQGASGTGVTIASGTAVIVFCDGVNYLQGSSSGGGSTVPAGATGDVQLNSAGAFGADTGKFIYNATTHSFTAPINNGAIDTDSFGGVAATAASGICVSGNCFLQQPAGSTDSYSNPGGNGYTGYLNKIARESSDNLSLYSSYVENPNTTAHQFTMVNAARLFEGATGAAGGGGTTFSINMLGTAPGSYLFGQESVDKALVMSMNDYTLGINQAFSSQVKMWGDGDKAFHYWYMNFGGCGHGNGDDERCTLLASQALETNGSVPVSTINSYDTTEHWLSLTAVNAEGTIGAGRNAIVTKNADGSDASVLTGCNVLTDQVGPPANGLPPALTTDCTLPVSTYIGESTAGIPTPRNLAEPTPMTVVFTTVSGTAPAAGSMACLTDPVAHEAVRVVSSSTSGSTVTMVVNVMQAFNSQYPTYIMAGGLCETWGREASGIMNADTAPIGPMSVVFDIVGVGADAHTLYYSIPEANNYQTLSNLYAYAVPISIPPSSVQLTRASGVVSLRFAGQSPNFSETSLTITGSPGAVFDGTFTALPGTCGEGICYTWAQAGTDVGSFVQATVTAGGGRQQLNAYKGALIVDTARPTVDASAGDHNIQISDNDVSWSVGATIEVPFGSMGVVYEKKLEQEYMPETTGDYTYSAGTGISGGYARMSWDNNNPDSMYQGTGGSFTLPRAIHLGGPIGEYFDIGNNGVGNGGFLPQSTLFRIMCETALCSRADGQGDLFNLNMNNTNGFIQDDFANNEIGVSIGDKGHQAPGLRVVEGGVLVNGKQWNSLGELHMGFDQTGNLVGAGPSQHEGLYIGGVVNGVPTTDVSKFVGCQTLFGTTNHNWCVGNANSVDQQNFAADGSLEFASAYGNAPSQFNNIYVGPHTPIGAMPIDSSLVLPGQNGFFYQLTAFDGISESNPGIDFTLGIAQEIDGTVQAASSFNSTNHPVLTCPALQPGYTSTTRYNIYAEPFNTVVVNAPRDNTTVLLGTCAPGATFADDNSITPIIQSPADTPQGGTVWSGLYRASSLGGYGWYVGNQTTAPLDTLVSRTGPGAVAVGNGTQGDHSGALDLANLTVDTAGTIAGSSICTVANDLCGGTYTLPPATTSTLGGVIPDGTSITVDGTGHISAVGGGSVGVSSFNSLTGAITLAGSTSVVINQVGNTLTLTASAPAQVYPGAGVPVSTGTAWGTSKPLAGVGAAVATTSNTGLAAGAVPIYTDTAGTLGNSGVLFTSFARLSASLQTAISTKTANYTITNADQTILCDATAGAVTLTLPTTVGAGLIYDIKKIDSSANACTLSGGAHNIDGSTTLALASQYDSTELHGSGQWWLTSTPGGGSSGVSSFNSLTGAVTLAGSSSVTLSQVGNTITLTAPGGGGSAGVASVNGLTNAVVLAGGTNTSLSTSGNTITINSAGGGGGGTNPTTAGFQIWDTSTFAWNSATYSDLEALQGTDTVNNTSVGFQTGTGGDSTLPLPISGRDYIGIKAGILQKVYGAGSWSPLFVLSCQPGIGDGFNVIPAGPYPQTTCKNETGATWTITSIKCQADTGSSTCNVTKCLATDTTSCSAVPLLTGAITGGPFYVSGTQSANTTLAPGDFLHITFTPDGLATTQMTIDVSGTY